MQIKNLSKNSKNGSKSENRKLNKYKKKRNKGYNKLKYNFPNFYLLDRGLASNIRKKNLNLFK